MKTLCLFLDEGGKNESSHIADLLIFTLLPFLSARCSPCRAGEALYPEVATVLCTLRFCVGPTERPEMEGGETGGAERDGGVHHSQQECHHRTHLPRGGSHGEYNIFMNEHNNNTAGLFYLLHPVYVWVWLHICF